MVNSSISVYIKIYILKNDTTNKYERFHFTPNVVTYKFMSIPTHT